MGWSIRKSFSKQSVGTVPRSTHQATTLTAAAAARFTRASAGAARELRAGTVTPMRTLKDPRFTVLVDTGDGSGSTPWRIFAIFASDDPALANVYACPAAAKDPWTEGVAFGAALTADGLVPAAIANGSAPSPGQDRPPRVVAAWQRQQIANAAEPLLSDRAALLPLLDVAEDFCTEHITMYANASPAFAFQHDHMVNERRTIGRFRAVLTHPCRDVRQTATRLIADGFAGTADELTALADACHHAPSTT